MASLISTLPNGKTGFIELLRSRMSKKGEFPAFAKALQELTDVTHDEYSSSTEITRVILSDFALTQKVIRLANSAMYAGMGGEVTTVTRALMILGLDVVSHIALSVRLVDTFSKTAPETEEANAQLQRVILAGEIARSVVGETNVSDGEEAIVCALMHNLSRLLLVFYFPEEWKKIQEISDGKPEAESAATLTVIGMTLEELSIEVAKFWRLPKRISNSMTIPATPGEVSIPGSPGWLRTIANFAADAATVAVSEENHAEGYKALASRYSDALMIPSDAILQSVESATNKAKESFVTKQDIENHGKPADSGKRLAAGVNEAIAALSEGMSFGNALNLVLETMYGSMRFNRVVAFLRDGASFSARAGFGAMMPGILPKLTFSNGYSPDVFHLSLTNNADVFIEDVASMKSETSMPVGFAKVLHDVRAFVLLPLTLNGKPVGLLYGDWEKGTTGIVEKSELMLLSSLRNHMIKSLAGKNNAR